MSKNSARLLFWVAEKLISQDIPWLWMTWPICPMDADKSTDLQTCAGCWRLLQTEWN